MTRVSKKITVKRHDGCIENPVFLAWIGTKGSWNYWLFGKTQTIQYVTSDDKYTERNTDDLENSTTIYDLLKRQAIKEMVIGADDISTEDMKGIERILFATRVQVLMNPTTWSIEGAKWQTVLVNAGSYVTRETRDKRHNIEMTIEFPKIFNQTQ